MIGKQIKGKGFRGLLNYLEGKEQAQLIGGNMSGRNAPELSAEFGLSRALNPHAKRKVYHASLSLPFNERLTNQQWGEVAAKYLEQMGYVNNQYAVYRHYDQDHDHIHIIASRIRLDTAKIVHDSWDYKRSEVVIRKLEREYGLQEVVSSSERIERNSSTGQRKRIEREEEDYHQGRREMPPELSVKQQLQEIISNSALNQPTMPEFMERLLIRGVEVKHGYTRTGKSKGISYGYQEQAFSGTKLGAAYTFPGLQKHLGIDYQSERDDLQIQRLLENPSLMIELPDIKGEMEKADNVTLLTDAVLVEEQEQYRTPVTEQGLVQEQHLTEQGLVQEEYLTEQGLVQEEYLTEQELVQEEYLTEQVLAQEQHLTEQVLAQEEYRQIYKDYSRDFTHLSLDERDKKVIVLALQAKTPLQQIREILSFSPAYRSREQMKELAHSAQREYEQWFRQQQSQQKNSQSRVPAWEL
jgi:Relaxase/Mobilisation nuclease domain